MTNSEVNITRLINAPIEKVWEAWTNPQNLKQWLSPEGMTTPEVTAEVKKDGSYRIVMEGHNMPDPSHNGKVAVGGKYLEIDKPNKLVFTWLWEGAPADTHTTTVTIHLKKITENKTELTLIHNGFADENMRDEHNMGWNSTMIKFNKFIE